jgi:hypothetical protein
MRRQSHLRVDAKQYPMRCGAPAVIRAAAETGGSRRFDDLAPVRRAPRRLCRYRDIGSDAGGRSSPASAGSSLGLEIRVTQCRAYPRCFPPQSWPEPAWLPQSLDWQESVCLSIRARGRSGTGTIINRVRVNSGQCTSGMSRPRRRARWTGCTGSSRARHGLEAVRRPAILAIIVAPAAAIPHGGRPEMWDVSEQRES